MTAQAPRVPETVAGRSGRRQPGGRKTGRRDESQMVPDVQFTSYYGRPVVKPAPWTGDIPAYLFLGGLAAGSSVLAAGAAATGRPSLRRTGRLGALAAITGGMYALVHDLGKPARFHHMLRVAKPTSPMSVGTWVLTAYAPLAAIAGGGELLPVLPRRLREGRAGGLVRFAGAPAGLLAALAAPAVAAYTAVLLSDTSTPAWNAARHELPFVFVGSACGAAGGLGMMGAAVREAAPARRLAAAGAVVELVMEHRMEGSMGLAAETVRSGKAARLMTLSKQLTAAGALGSLTIARRSRLGALVSGAALLAGSAYTRFGIFEAGQESARDPKYTVVPQRERLNAGRPARSDGPSVGGSTSEEAPHGTHGGGSTNGG
jgi:formate-dependent nitrite reductase membrane component NrfD